MARGPRRRRRTRTGPVPDVVAFLATPRGRLPRRVPPDEAAAAVVSLHDANGGATFSLYFSSLAGRRLYAVSVYPERGRVVLGNRLDVQTVRHFIADNRDLLIDPRNAVGTWYNEDDDVTYLDVSTVLPSERRARLLASRYNQIAVFDLDRFLTIDTGGSGNPVPGLPAEVRRLGGFRRRRRRT